MAALLPLCSAGPSSRALPCQAAAPSSRRCHVAARPYLAGASLLQRPQPCSGGRQARRRERVAPTMGLFGLGFPELAVIAGVTALIFGPSKLPSIGKELGKTVKSFQTAAKEFETELKTATTDKEDLESSEAVSDGKKK